jgi:FAD:protein FMN transferase
MAGESGLLLTTYGEGGPLRRYEHRALGTWNVLLLADPDPARPEGADAAAAAALALLDRLEDELSRFRPDSDVSLLNALGADRAVPVGRALFEVLGAARAAWEETGGAFDPTVKPLLDAWGFPRGPARVPPGPEIERLLLARGMDRVLLDPADRSARFDRPGVELDLGAIGKGYAVDRLRALLEERGVRAGAVLSGRSTIAAWGAPPGGGAWTVEVAHPGEPDRAVAAIEMEPGSLSTSAAYEERFVHEGVEYGHILDPRTGRPARTGLRSVTVWTESALRGDVLSTALFVLGAEEGARLLRPPERASALLVEDDSSAWGGLGVRALHSGPPGFRMAR